MKQKEERIVFTKKELWLNQAPCFNFELDEDELLLEDEDFLELDDLDDDVPETPPLLEVDDGFS